jgi:hypothetical protein
MVNVGGHTKSTNSTFTGNVWSTEFEPGWGPMYDDVSYTTAGSGNIWSGNKLNVVSGTNWMAAGNNGRYWWPGDSNPTSSSQVFGHLTDYVNP